ncbi:MAG: PstS family phosphate ABC transporter substrate-binding protein [Candidatus Nanopelagicales bacterium]
MNRSTLRRAVAPAAIVLSLSLALTACGDDDDAGSGSDGESVSGSVVIDGSSTVFPLTSAAAELFQEENPDVQVSVGTSGTGGGFEKFCAGETDISDASRLIDEDETRTCEENQVEFAQLDVANDALTVIVNTDNDWAECLTTEQLATIWGPDSTVASWNEVDPSFPNEPITLFGPGTDSGTFDYFTAEINGEEGASRTDFQGSEDDNVIVQGVSGSTGAMGYLGYTYYQENEDTLKAVEVDSGSGCVAPSADTVQDETYTPLGRQLFIYPSKQALEKAQVNAFVNFYIENIDEIVEAAGFIPLNDAQKETLQSEFEALQG